MVEKGYEPTRVADLVDLSGISRSAFLPPVRRQEGVLPRRRRGADPADPRGHGGGRARRFRRGADAGGWRPSCAWSSPSRPPPRMCFGEIYAAGPEAVTLINRTPDTFEEFFTAQFEQIPGRERKPSDMVRAMIGGLQKVVHKRLYRDEPRVLLDLAPQICGWWLSYPPPPGSLGWPRRRRPKRQQTFEERQVHDMPADRVLRCPPTGCCGRSPQPSPRRATPAPRWRDRRSRLDLPAHLLRELRQQGRGAAGGARHGV